MRILTTLDRYLLKELVVPLIASTLAFIFLFQANFMIFLLKELNTSSIPFSALIQVILYKTPDFIRMTLVIGIALATALASSRLARESEIIAMRSSGIRLTRIIFPIALVGLLFSGLNFYVMEGMVPVAEEIFRKKMADLYILSAAPEFKSDVVLELPNYAAMIKSITRGSQGEILLNKVVLFEKPLTKERWLYSAQSGSYQKGVWSLENPFATMINYKQLILAEAKKDLIIEEKISVPDVFLVSEPDERSLKEIKKEIRSGKAKGDSVGDIETSYYARFAVPFACFLFAIVAPIYSIRLSSKGAFAGLMVSLLGVLIYYFTYLVGSQFLGKNLILPPMIAAWLPNIILVGFGLLGIRKV